MAAAQLPHELLCLIAKQFEPSIHLGPFAVVSKAWQAAFEERIYSSLLLRNATKTEHIVIGQNELELPKRGLTLEKIEQIVNERRRATVKDLHFRVAVPHWLRDHSREVDEDEGPYDDYMRRENDQAFSRAISALWDLLASPAWEEKAKPIKLSITLQAENVYTGDMDTEPGTGPVEAGDNILPDYRARLVKGTVLDSTSCVRSVNFPQVRMKQGFENGVSLSAQICIMAACSALVDMSLDGTYLAQNQYEKKRIELAQSLSLIPPRIQSLSLEWRDEVSLDSCQIISKIIQTVPIPSDTLSKALHTASLSLRHLHIAYFDFTPEIFQLSDKEAAMPAVWPNLETIELISIPLALPNEAGLTFRYFPDDSGIGIPLSHEGNGRLPYRKNQTSEESVVATYFDTLYISAGHAARKMPRLKRMLLSFDQPYSQYLEFGIEGEQHFLRMGSFYGYSPTQAVLDAWQVPMGGMGGCIRAVCEPYLTAGHD